MLTPADIRRLFPEQYEFLWRSLLREDHPHDYQHIDGHGIDCIAAGIAVQAYHHQGGPWPVVQRKFREDLAEARASGLTFDKWVFATTFPFADPKHNQWLHEQIEAAKPLVVEKWGDEALASLIAKHPKLAHLVGALQELSGGTAVEVHNAGVVAVGGPGAPGIFAQGGAQGGHGIYIENRTASGPTLGASLLLNLALGEVDRLRSALMSYPIASASTSIVERYADQIASVLPPDAAEVFIRATHAVADQERERRALLESYDNAEPGTVLWRQGIAVLRGEARDAGGPKVAYVISLLDQAKEKLSFAAGGSSARKASIRKLLDLAEHGVQHIQNGSESDEQAAWKRFAEWEHSVREALAEGGASESDKSWFYILDVYEPRRLNGRTPLLTKLREEAAEKIHRLREIVRRMEEG